MGHTPPNSGEKSCGLLFIAFTLELFVATLADQRQREPTIRREREQQPVPHQHLRQPHQQLPHLELHACNCTLSTLTGKWRAGKPRLASATHKTTQFPPLYLQWERLHLHTSPRRPAADLARNANPPSAIIPIAYIETESFDLETRNVQPRMSGRGRLRIRHFVQKFGALNL